MGPTGEVKRLQKVLVRSNVVDVSSLSVPTVYV